MVVHGSAVHTTVLRGNLLYVGQFILKSNQSTVDFQFISMHDSVKAVADVRNNFHTVNRYKLKFCFIIHKHISYYHQKHFYPSGALIRPSSTAPCHRPTLPCLTSTVTQMCVFVFNTTCHFDAGRPKGPEIDSAIPFAAGDCGEQKMQSYSIDSALLDLPKIVYQAIG